MDETDDIPIGLRRDLETAYGHAGAVPHEVDRAILGAARPLRRRRMILRWASLAAAAVVTLVVIHQAVVRHASAPPQQSAAATEDLNGDGRVDVLDAFYLARRLAQAQTTKAQWDFNHDGRVDRADADAIAMAVVSLSRPSVQ